MNTENKTSCHRVNASDFKCNVCNGPLNYVQILNDHIRIQEDFFECEHCGKRITSQFHKDEDIPAFFD